MSTDPKAVAESAFAAQGLEPPIWPNEPGYALTPTAMFPLTMNARPPNHSQNATLRSPSCEIARG
jgi:hypothetical protein